MLAQSLSGFAKQLVQLPKALSFAIARLSETRNGLIDQSVRHSNCILALHDSQTGNDLGVVITSIPYQPPPQRESSLLRRSRLGGEVRMDLPDEWHVTAEIAPGTQPGTVVVLKGEGMPRLDRRGRGDLHVLLEVHLPNKLSKRARKLLQELEAELTNGTEREALNGVTGSP